MENHARGEVRVSRSKKRSHGRKLRDFRPKAKLVGRRDRFDPAETTDRAIRHLVCKNDVIHETPTTHEPRTTQRKDVERLANKWGSKVNAMW